MWALWKEAVRNKRFIILLIISLIGLIAFAMVLPYFFIAILLPKPGVTLIDPLLNFFTPKDWSIEIFVLIYLCVVISLVCNFTTPKTILVGLQSYFLVDFIPITSSYLFSSESFAA